MIVLLKTRFSLKKIFKMKKIPCGTCGVMFEPKSDRNKYHNRSCFKKAFWIRQKEKNKKIGNFPTFKCPNCGQKITLPFDPVKEISKWANYSCPGCNTLMINVSEEIITQDEQVL